MQKRVTNNADIYSSATAIHVQDEKQGRYTGYLKLPVIILEGLVLHPRGLFIYLFISLVSRVAPSVLRLGSFKGDNIICGLLYSCLKGSLEENHKCSKRFHTKTGLLIKCPQS